MRAMDIAKFSIGFDHRDRGRLHELWDSALDTEQWSDGPLTVQFEQAWSEWNGLPSVATSSWTGAALAALEFFSVRGHTVLCPSNTFMATPRAIVAAGAQVEFVDCNRDDLCMSFEDFERKAARTGRRPSSSCTSEATSRSTSSGSPSTAASEGILLLEDARMRTAPRGTAGERARGAMQVSGRSPRPRRSRPAKAAWSSRRHPELIEFARRFRGYGKPYYDQPGLNYRLSEFTAALGIVGVERLDEITDWKNTVARDQLDEQHPNRVLLPEGMVSGHYKYVVFDPVERSTGKVYDEPCHRLFGHQVDLPNSDWVAENHWCVPLYYQPVAEPLGEVVAT